MIPGFFLAENKCNETEKILICTKVVEEYSLDKVDNLHAQFKQYICACMENTPEKIFKTW